MVLLNTKNKNSLSSSSPLSLKPSDEKGSISFSDLLQGISEKKDAKHIQNGSLILSFASEEKSVKVSKEALKTDKQSVSVLNIEQKSSAKTDEELLELNPSLTSGLNKEEVKVLINDAKNYLKEKIRNSDEYKKAEIKELPKTLGGLIDAAKKLGVDIEKITLQEIRPSQKSEEQSVEIKEITVQKDDSSDKKILRVKNDTIASKELLAEKKSEKQINRAADNAQIQDIKNNDKSVEAKKETPLFKAQSVNTVSSEHTSTQQLVQVKSNNMTKTEQKTQKDKADETLKLLLRNENTSTSGSNLTADFSVATARVIAPSAATNNTNSLEQLLKGDSLAVKEDSESVSVKPETVTTHKADSFEVKLNEAKQMIKYLSTDVKNAIDDYRSPFTRVKVQLNPQHLGEVDLTVVQRGKNLHVNISSNNAAVNMLSMNSNELKAQLSNNGINNATLNFSDNSQNQSANGGGHQQKENERKAYEEYGYYESEETNEEMLSSLEIVVPRYI